jgi:hypothetical protein
VAAFQRFQPGHERGRRRPLCQPLLFFPLLLDLPLKWSFKSEHLKQSVWNRETRQTRQQETNRIQPPAHPSHPCNLRSCSITKKAAQGFGTPKSRQIFQAVNSMISR